MEGARERGRSGVEAVGECRDCVRRQRRPMDLGGLQQEGQPDEKGEEDGGGENEALHSGLRRAQRRLVAAAGRGSGRSMRVSGYFAGDGRRCWGLVAGDLRHPHEWPDGRTASFGSDLCRPRA